MIFKPDLNKIPDNTPKNMKISSFMMKGYIAGNYQKVTNNYSQINSGVVNFHITAF